MTLEEETRPEHEGPVANDGVDWGNDQIIDGRHKVLGLKMDSSYKGWDNPFRPEGEVSHDADEILRMWKKGKAWDKSTTESDSPANQSETVGVQPKPATYSVDIKRPENPKAAVEFEVKRERMESPQQVVQKVTINDVDVEEKKAKKCCTVM